MAGNSRDQIYVRACADWFLSLFSEDKTVMSSNVYFISFKQHMTLKRFSYFQHFRHSAATALRCQRCVRVHNKMSYLEYFYLFWVNYQYLRHRSLFAKSVIWGQFVRINHKSLPVTVNKHQEVKLWKETQTEAFCSTNQLQTIKCNCYFAFRLNENQQREKKQTPQQQTLKVTSMRRTSDEFHHP